MGGFSGDRDYLGLAGSVEPNPHQGDGDPHVDPIAQPVAQDRGGGGKADAQIGPDLDDVVLEVRVVRLLLVGELRDQPVERDASKRTVVEPGHRYAGEKVPPPQGLAPLAEDRSRRGLGPHR